VNATEYERVQGYAPLVPIVGVTGFRAMLECGHTQSSRAVPAGARVEDVWRWRAETWWEPNARTRKSTRRCKSCLSTELLGPYLCTIHPECREPPQGVPRARWIQMRAECWNETAKGRPRVADAIKESLEWRPIGRSPL
jgi:hypothetical protein